MHGVAGSGDKLDQIRSQNSEEDGMKGMINASAKPFPRENFGQSYPGNTLVLILKLYIFTFPEPNYNLDA